MPHWTGTRRAVSSTVLGLLLLAAISANAEHPAEGPKPGTKAAASMTRLSSPLVQATSGANPQDAARRLGFRVYQERIQVHVQCESEDSARTVVAALQQDGAEAIVHRDVRVQAWVSSATIGVLATIEGVVRIERPMYVTRPPEPEQGSSTGPVGALRAGARLTEGLAAMNGPAWQSAGATGQGISVGVIDSFSGYEALIGTELPPTSRLEFQKIGGGPRDTSPHGTACAEIIYDIAPGLEKMYLVETNTSLDVQVAIETLQARGVRVISASFGWDGYTAMDGSGFMQTTLAAFKNAGGLYVQAAGNERNFTWWGAFADANENGWADFQSGASDEINDILLTAKDRARYQCSAALT